MKLDLFKKIIDEIEGKVQFVTLASRGEPLVSKDINEMIKYTSGKFLNLKINSNASLLNEEKFIRFYLVMSKLWFFPLMLQILIYIKS